MRRSRSTSAGPELLIELGWALVRAGRPTQWSKNLLLFLALFFTVNEAWYLRDLERATSLLARTTLAFAIFSVLSGATYLVNDIFDIESDKRHPKKHLRPIASGKLPLSVAWAASLTLIPASLAAAFLLESPFGVVAFIYTVTTVAYTLMLKRLILIDIFAISSGFVLRVVGGAIVLEVPISPWLYICTGLGALFIAIAKRRSELVSLGDRSARLRGTLEWYTVGLLDKFMAAVATSIIVAYILYAFTASNMPHNHAMMFTIPFVVYGLFRYMFLVHTKNMGENPESILAKDWPLAACAVFWLLTSASVLVVFRG